MILSPDQFKDASVYDLLVAAERGHAGLDHAWLHAILDRGEAAVDGLLKYGLEERPDDRVFLDDVLVDLLYESRSPKALPLALSIAGRSSEDLAPRLILMFQALGEAAVEPLLELYEASGKGEESDLGYLLASLGVRDPRIFAVLEERLELDPVDGACCLATYGDPAALPALEMALASSEEFDRPAIRDAIVQLTAGVDSPSEDSDHIWDDYPKQAGPSFSLLDPEEIRRFLASPVAAYRRDALTALAALEEDEPLFDPVWDLARRDPDESVRARAWEYLATAWHRKDIRESLLDVLQNENTPGLDRAGALAAVADHEKDSPLVRRYLDTFLANPATRAIALRAALNTGSDRYAGEFVRSLDDADSAVVLEAIQGVGYFELQEAAGRLVSFFEDPDLRESALANYAFAAPSPNNRRGMRNLLEKIDRLARGLDFDESLLVKDALNTRLERYDVEPLFSRSGAILGVEPAVSQKVGRNDPCPCGSGKKYKKCCGA